MRVAVEGSLSDISRELKTFGYDVVRLDNNNLSNVNAVVISGMDKNMLGINDIKTEAPVINASGLTALEVRNEIDKRL